MNRHDAFFAYTFFFCSLFLAACFLAVGRGYEKRVDGPPMPPYTPTPKVSSTPTRFPSPTPEHPTLTPLPTVPGTPYPVWPTRTARPTATGTPPVYPYRQQWLPYVPVRRGQ